MAIIFLSIQMVNSVFAVILLSSLLAITIQAENILVLTATAYVLFILCQLKGLLISSYRSMVTMRPIYCQSSSLITQRWRSFCWKTKFIMFHMTMMEKSMTASPYLLVNPMKLGFKIKASYLSFLHSKTQHKLQHICWWKIQKSLQSLNKKSSKL